MLASPGVKCGFGLQCRQPAECVRVLADMCVYLCFFGATVPSQLGGVFTVYSKVLDVTGAKWRKYKTRITCSLNLLYDATEMRKRVRQKSNLV